MRTLLVPALGFFPLSIIHYLSLKPYLLPQRLSHLVMHLLMTNTAPCCDALIFFSLSVTATLKPHLCVVSV